MTQPHGLIHPMGGELRPSIDDPTWVLSRYREAKELISDLLQGPLDDDLREQFRDWHYATYLDECTTLGPDCACNRRHG
jgi:hypothetical protein